MRFFYSLVLSITLLIGSFIYMLWANTVYAAEVPAQAATTVSLDSLVTNAFTIVKAFDGSAAKQVWDSSSQQTKKYQTRDVFAKSIADSRKPLGDIAGRKWLSVETVEITKPGNVAPGNYINVLFASSFTGSKEAARESVTYVNENGNWYFAGYMLLLPPSVANPVGGFAPPSASQPAQSLPDGAESKTKSKKK